MEGVKIIRFGFRFEFMGEIHSFITVMTIVLKGMVVKFNQADSTNLFSRWGC